MEDRIIGTAKIKCPKCKGTELELRELWRNHCITFEQTGGVVKTTYGNLSEGEPYKVEAECNGCGHEWTLRGAIQITDAVTD